MIAKIGRSSNLYGALAYNNLKVGNENGKILLCNKMIETVGGNYAVSQLMRSFEPYLVANRNTEKHTLHISLNPDPKDSVDDVKYKEMAIQYMREMGYGEQPFIVFKHTDIDRSHIHIVSICVDEHGKKISDKFEKMRSMTICRTLEKEHDLIIATGKEQRQNEKVFRPVDYKSGDIKSQIAGVVRHLPKYYQFQTIGEYNALLGLFNINAELVDVDVHDIKKQGLLYIPLNEKGERAGHPFKSSLFGKNAGYSAITTHIEKCKSALKDSPVKNTVKEAVLLVLGTATNERSFKKSLSEMGINMKIRRNDTGRIYGVTFIDHNSRTVWNGSRLGKEVSANLFNDCWKDNIEAEAKSKETPKLLPSESKGSVFLQDEEPHPLFQIDFRKDSSNLIEEFGSLLLPEIHGEDYEELDFENKIKRAMKKRKPRKI
ncbi:relaxase [Elizabethkingia anophelis]|nr:relaxase [Elizabethkingia anophelis]